MNQFTVKSFPNNDVVRQRGDWRGVASDVCYVSSGLLCLDVGRCDVGDPRVFGRKDWGAASKEIWLRMERCRSRDDGGGKQRVEGEASKARRERV